MSFFCSVITLCLTLCDPMSCNMPGFPFLTISCSMLKLKSIESVILSNYLISSATPFFCLQSFPTLGFFSNESSLWIRWPKYWSFSFSNSPFNEYQGWFPLLTGLISLLSKEATALEGGLELEQYVGESACWSHLGRSTGVQVASALGLEVSKLYMCFLRAESCIPVVDSYWYMAKPIQYCKVKKLKKKKKIMSLFQGGAETQSSQDSHPQ